ncbi:phosphoadenosine phosphosulfate reductase family protein [Almyronema epifaneia]|uniref:Phosphoadenosine phosphosulfate reductase family protein n=1 Tax=Almyronema epifaneia S1 TaxID=2991925 RepID=A0ABW6IDY5_9CYAN
MSKPVRHILGLSGGKDSTALAVFMRQQYPELEIEYFFLETNKELPETYDYLDRIEARLGIKVVRLEAERGFDHWFEVYGQVLPSPKMRWCTDFMKIRPLEKFIGNDEAVSYIGIRADENREGYISTKPNIRPVFPFKEHGLTKADIFRILDESGLGLPDYYRWRSRSGCFFCFYQRKYEWIMLSKEHPDLFKKAVAYEQASQKDRGYTWVQGTTLLKLLERQDEIIEQHNKSIKKEEEKLRKRNASLADVLESVLDEEDDEIPCMICS